MRKLKYYRLVSEMSQKKLGQEAGCSQALISMLERGQIFPGSDLRNAITRVLKVPSDILFSEEDMSNNKTDGSDEIDEIS